MGNTHTDKKPEIIEMKLAHLSDVSDFKDDAFEFSITRHYLYRPIRIIRPSVGRQTIHLPCPICKEKIGFLVWSKSSIQRRKAISILTALIALIIIILNENTAEWGTILVFVIIISLIIFFYNYKRKIIFIENSKKYAIGGYRLSMHELFPLDHKYHEQDELKKTYAKLSDEQLLRLLDQPDQLIVGAIEVIREELKRRKVQPSDT